MRGSTSRLEREDLEIDLGSHPRPATYLLHDLANPPNRLSLSFLGSITGIRLPPYQAYAKQFCGSNVNAFTPLPGQGQVLPGYLPPIVLQARTRQRPAGRGTSIPQRSLDPRFPLSAQGSGFYKVTEGARKEFRTGPTGS